MTRPLIALAALAGLATPLHAGGLDLSGQSVAILFEEGNHARLSYGVLSPDVSGVQRISAAGLPAGGGSGDMAETLQRVSLAYKHSFSNGLEAALILDQPFGADIAYPEDRPYFARGTTAELESSALTGLVKYRFPSNVSVYGGVRYQRLEARAFIPFATAPLPPDPNAPYRVEGERDDGVGYVAGIGYEIPKIALRVSLTYSTEIAHQLETHESSFLGPADSVTDVDTPQSVNLKFQSGVAPDTLLFGSIRWVDWSDFDISPATYEALFGEALVAYPEDRVSYALGLGRQFTPDFAGSVAVGYEPEQNNLSDNLGPVDGNVSLTLGGSYTFGRMTVSGGVSHVWIGNTRARLVDTPASEFEDNTAVGFGLQFGYTF